MVPVLLRVLLEPVLVTAAKGIACLVHYHTYQYDKSGRQVTAPVLMPDCFAAQPNVGPARVCLLWPGLGEGVQHGG
jgi:hypothetical protein